MKGHNGLVHAVAIHPSGRAALSVAADGKLMLWNLTTGMLHEANLRLLKVQSCVQVCGVFVFRPALTAMRCLYAWQENATTLPH